MKLTSEVKKRLKNDLVCFRDVVLVNDPKFECEPGDFHFQLSDLLLHETSHVAIEMFRESGKSSYALRAYPLHCLAYPSKDRDFIVIIKQNQTTASAKLKDIITEYKSNPLLQHNLVKINEENNKVFSVDVKNERGQILNVRIEAYGKGTGIRGLNNQDRRPKVIILDDIQDKDDARSETITATDWDWFLSDIVFLGENTRIFFIGNNLGDRCCIEKCINNAKELHFKVIRVPIMIDNRPAWPSRHTVEGIMAERADYAKLGKLDIWMAEKMCQAVAEENRTFNPDDFRYYSPHRIDELVNCCNIYACLDPASSMNPESCFRAITITGVSQENYWFLLGCRYGRWDTFGIISEIFNTVIKYRLREFYIEKGWWVQVAQPLIEQEMRRRNVFFNVIPLEHGKVGTKLERIKALQPRFKSHTVFFPDDADWLPEFKTELAGVTKDAIKSEYIDLVDAFAMTDQVAQAPVNYRSSDPMSRFDRDGGTSYEAESLFDISGY